MIPNASRAREGVEDRKYHQDLATVRERILGFVLRRLVPHRADFAQAEDIAQSCVIALWEQYPEKRELAEMVRIAIGAARHKIAQFHRDREKVPGRLQCRGGLDGTSHRAKPAQRRKALRARRRPRRRRTGSCSRWSNSRFAAARLLRLKLIEQKSYAEIRLHHRHLGKHL